MNAGLTHSELVRFDDRSQWLDGRACSIGSSDAPTLLGYGYAGTSKCALWAEKCHGVKPEIAESLLKRFAKGKAAESYVAKLCEIDYGWNVQFDPDNSYRRSLEVPYMTASLDGWMVLDGEHVAIEFKNISSWVASKEWDIRSGKAPLKYTIQLQHQLAVTGWKRGFLVALVGYDTFPIEVRRHDDLIDVMRAEYADFWRCVLEKRPPEVDDSDATHQALSKVYEEKPMKTLHLDDECSAMVDLIAECEGEIDRHQKLLGRTRNELITVAGDAECLITSDDRWFSFRSSRGGKRTLAPYKRKR